MFGWIYERLPAFLQKSRKALIWIAGGGLALLAQFGKAWGVFQGWPPDKLQAFDNLMTAVQTIVGAISLAWTSQIAAEDAAAKVGLPPSLGPTTTTVATAGTPYKPATIETTTGPAPVVAQPPPIQGLPPRGKGE